MYKVAGFAFFSAFSSVTTKKIRSVIAIAVTATIITEIGGPVRACKGGRKKKKKERGGRGVMN